MGTNAERAKKKFDGRTSCNASNAARDGGTLRQVAPPSRGERATSPGSERTGTRTCHACLTLSCTGIGGTYGINRHACIYRCMRIHLDNIHLHTTAFLRRACSATRILGCWASTLLYSALDHSTCVIGAWVPSTNSVGRCCIDRWACFIAPCVYCVFFSCVTAPHTCSIQYSIAPLFFFTSISSSIRTICI